jgi:hypothetical protein
MVELYLFRGFSKELTLSELFFGYEDSSISLIHEDLSIYEGKEVALNSFVTAMFNENSVSDQVQGIYTGSLNIQQISRVRFANDKNYVNRMMNISIGNITTPVQVSPSKVSEKLVSLDTSTNGMQFIPSFNQTMDTL